MELSDLLSNLGLGFAVALDKPGGFIGRDAIDPARPRAHRQVFVRLDDPAPMGMARA